ncbi:histidine phosphatase family protein [Paenibacillus sp. USDA918EY]|nr:histidine phosphatase family protein [Paenibacillus sp. USDA918EY]
MDETFKQRGDYMEIVFIRHGHGEHLIDYPHQLNKLHPGLTSRGISQIQTLRQELPIYDEDLVLVSPTKRTIETARILCPAKKIYVTPLVGPRMFPQNPDYPALVCDEIYTKEEVRVFDPECEVLDLGLDCWTEGINRMDQNVFEIYAGKLLDWCLGRAKRVIIISHDGTITNYRLLLGEKDLTRDDFLGEAGVFETKIFSH